MSRDRADRIVIDGGKLYGQEDVAEEALGEYVVFLRKDSDPVVVAWDIFMNMMKSYGVTEDAFRNAWPPNGVVRFAISKGLSVQDAEDIDQITAEMVWKQFMDFKPYLASWTTWIMMIAERQIIKFFRDMKEKDDVDDLVIPTRDRIRVVEQGWSIPIICRQWMESGNQNKSRFAAAVLLSWHNMNWCEPTSKSMAELVGVSQTECHRLFKEFIYWVMSYESKNRF